jgi:glycine cleavage system H protein
VNVLGFEFPDGLHYCVEPQTWARLEEGGFATVGITALGIRQSGEIYMCRPKGVGAVVEQGRSIAVVELAKSIVSVKSPVGGEVVEVNPLLAQAPELVHRDPYGQGWLARLRLVRWDGDLALLVHGDAVAAAMEHHAWLNGIESA